MKGKLFCKKLLILTSATGAGHDTHARAAAEWCRRIYGDAVKVQVVHGLEESHPLARMGVDLYNQIQRCAPWAHHVYYHILELPGWLNLPALVLGRQYWVDLFLEIQPDAILSTHDFLNRGYFELAWSVLGNGVRCATYGTEFEGGYGFSRNWVNRKAQYYFGRTQESVEAAMRLGMKTERALVAGHWAPPPFYNTAMNEGERRDYLRREFSLAGDVFTLLLSTGGAGAQNHRDFLRSLQGLGDRIQVIALAGRDESGRRRLEEWSERKLDFPVRVLGFRQDMNLLLQSVSATLARAGATTAGEALLVGCPLIFNAVGGMMPQEVPTWNYFRKRGLGSVVYRATDLRDVVEGWLDVPESLELRRGNISRCRDVTSPERALRLLLEGNELGWQASG
ncbi:MAG: hypothetical protein HC904_06960 [Blastochloris sp.]|nr:hypothetical protein [Blastochloris sp.]